MSQREERRIWDVKSTESSLLLPRPNTSRGAEGSLAAGISQLPVLHPPQRDSGAKGTKSSGCSRAPAVSPRWFTGLRAVGQREKLPGRALLPALHKPPRWKTSPKALALEWWGRMVPFPLGSWLRRDQLSCGCWTGRKGEKERQLSAKEVWGLPMSWCWFMCAAGVPITPAMGLGGRGGRLGGRGGAPGCLAAVRAAQPPSQLLDLLSNNDGVLLTNLLSSFCLVVVGTGMHVRVPVNGTEQVPTAAVET